MAVLIYLVWPILASLFLVSFLVLTVVVLVLMLGEKLLIHKYSDQLDNVVYTRISIY
jgi:hypothetical protein